MISYFSSKNQLQIILNSLRLSESQTTLTINIEAQLQNYRSCRNYLLKGTQRFELLGPGPLSVYNLSLHSLHIQPSRLWRFEQKNCLGVEIT